jgi:hypothetical protein
MPAKANFGTRSILCDEPLGVGPGCQGAHGRIRRTLSLHALPVEASLGSTLRLGSA